jgi:predicted transcriptional regulator
MSNAKITNKSALLYAIEIIGDSNAEVAAKLNKMVEQLDKKNASPKKMTAQQEKNEGIKAEIVDFMRDNEGKGFTITDLLKSVACIEGDSNQHVSALMRQLVQAGVVTKYSEKRRTYFTIASED